MNKHKIILQILFSDLLVVYFHKVSPKMMQ